jgi:mercuric reductase
VVVCADARLPNVEELGLDHAGVRLGDDGRVTVDQQQRTSAAGIYAAGNVTGPPWLTNRAVAAGTVAGGNALGGTGQVRDERLPRSVTPGRRLPPWA